MPAPSEFLQFIDSNADGFIQRLSDAVAIPSISGDPVHRQDVVKMANWLNGQLKSYGVHTQLVDLGKHTMDGQELSLPPAILGRIGTDPTKKTVLIYGHFDVQPANKSDGWDTDPFTLVVHEDGRLIGRGSSDDKGPILGWLNVLQYHHQNNKELPLNIRFCFEGMEESGSEGLDDLVRKESQPGGWFNGVDCVCIVRPDPCNMVSLFEEYPQSDNYWLNTRTPALTYGLRGLAYFKLTISGPARDLHSGVFGRTVHEPMTDLIALMSKLVDVSGKILIPGVDEMVEPPTESEKYGFVDPSNVSELQLTILSRAIYERLDYSVTDVEESAGGQIALSASKVDVLMGRMRYPSLSLHGIEGAFSGAGAKTVIPAKVSGKFSIRLVPPQTPELVEPLVIQYLTSEFAKLKSKNMFSIENLHGGKPWMADHKHWNFEAAKIATRAVYNQEPDLTREGGSIPVTLTFAESLGVNVLLLPMGRGDDGA
ncbi:hypothetical protein C0989_000969, partial [Termitomyces sp. Mn162]